MGRTLFFSELTIKANEHSLRTHTKRKHKEKFVPFSKIVRWMRYELKNIVFLLSKNFLHATFVLASCCEWTLYIVVVVRPAIHFQHCCALSKTLRHTVCLSWRWTLLTPHLMYFLYTFPSSRRTAPLRMVCPLLFQVCTYSRPKRTTFYRCAAPFVRAAISLLCTNAVILKTCSYSSFSVCATTSSF